MGSDPACKRWVMVVHGIRSKLCTWACVCAASDMRASLCMCVALAWSRGYATQRHWCSLCIGLHIREACACALCQCHMSGLMCISVDALCGR